MTDSRCHLCEHDMEWYGHRCIQYFCSIDFDGKYRSGHTIGMQSVLTECISREFHNCHGLGEDCIHRGWCSCTNNIPYKIENASRATVSFPIWGESPYKEQSCEVVNYPSSQVIGTRGFLVLALSFTVALWSNVCFSVYGVFSALMNLTSPRKKSDTCILPSGHIHKFKFYQLHALMGEFCGNKNEEEIRTRDHFLVNQHDFWATEAEF